VTTWRWSLLVVGLVAAAVRLWLLPTARFGGDEAYFFSTAQDILDGHQRPLLGGPITDGAARLLGPSFFYLMVLPLLVSRTPWAQYVFVEMIGAITVVMFAMVVQRVLRADEHRARVVATIVGLLCACMPWCALFADRTWNPNVLPLVVVSLLYVIAIVRDRRGSVAVVWALPLLAWMSHFHLSAVVVLPGVIVLLWRQGHWTAARATMTIAMTTVVMMPMIVHELSTGGSNTLALWRETVGRVGGERQPWSFLWVPVYALRMLTIDASYHELSGYWGGPNEAACVRLWWQDRSGAFSIVRVIAMTISIAWACCGVVSAWRLRNSVMRPWLWAAMVVVVTNTALIAVTAKPVFGHYVHSSFFFVAWLWAAAAWSCWQRRWLFMWVGVVAVAGVVMTVHISRSVDAKIGLRTHQEVAELVSALPQPVMIQFRGVYGSAYDWQVFLKHQAQPMRWGSGGSRITIVSKGAARGTDVRELSHVDVEIGP
jgi:hypothetical protein